MRKSNHPSVGTISADEAYSKQVILQRLEISQSYWDKMLDEGLSYTQVGHSRWVTGQELIEHLRRKAVRKGTKDHDTEDSDQT